MEVERLAKAATIPLFRKTNILRKRYAILTSCLSAGGGACGGLRIAASKATAYRLVLAYI